jgi:protein ImuA
VAALPERREISLPGVWRADELGAQTDQTLTTGHPELDPALPGGGWPRGSLTEILQAQPGIHEWRLLLPALRQAAQAGQLVLIASPHQPHLAMLSCSGLPANRVLLVQARTPAERLWAAEQALRCREVGALMAWLPQTRTEQLRRLHLASQTSPAPLQPLVFAFRPLDARHESSPAPLRLTLQAQGGEGLEVNLIKRRGPAMDQPLRLAAPLAVTPALRRASTLPSLSCPAPADQNATPAQASDHAVDRPRHAERLARPAHA